MGDELPSCGTAKLSRSWRARRMFQQSARPVLSAPRRCNPCEWHYLRNRWSILFQLEQNVIELIRRNWRNPEWGLKALVMPVTLGMRSKKRSLESQRGRGFVRHFANWIGGQWALKRWLRIAHPARPRSGPSLTDRRVCKRGGHFNVRLRRALQIVSCPMGNRIGDTVVSDNSALMGTDGEKPAQFIAFWTAFSGLCILFIESSVFHAIFPLTLLFRVGPLGVICGWSGVQHHAFFATEGTPDETASRHWAGLRRYCYW